MARPRTRPKPPDDPSRLREASPRANGSVMVSRSPLGILGPSSITSMTILPPSAGERRTVARVPNSTALSMRFATARPMLEISLYPLADGVVRDEPGEQAHAGDGRA